MAEKRVYSFNGMYGVSIDGVYSRNLENTKKICQLTCVDFIYAIRGKFNYKERLKSDIKTLKIGFAAEKSAKYGNIIKYCMMESG